MNGMQRVIVEFVFMGSLTFPHGPYPRAGERGQVPQEKSIQQVYCVGLFIEFDFGKFNTIAEYA